MRRLALLNLLARGAACLLLASVAAGIGPRPGRAATSPFADLQDNTWVKVNPVPTERYVPGATQGEYVLQTTGEPWGRTFSGTAYGTGKIMYFGGGHCAYQGNDVEVYDVRTNTWTQSYRPEHRDCATDGGWGTPELSPLGRPQTEHTYQQFTYDPASGRFIGMIRPGTWAFDPVTMQWTPLAGRYSTDPAAAFSPDFWTAMGLVLYDSSRRVVVGFTGSSNDPRVTNRVWTFDLSTQVWTAVGSIPSGAAFDFYGIYDPINRLHVISATDGAGGSGRRSFWTYSLEINTWREVTSFPSELASSGRLRDISYDSLNRRVVAFTLDSSGSPQIWVYDLSGDIWTKMPRVGTQPPVNRGWGNLQYDPINNVFILVGVTNTGGGGSPGSAAQTWAYRYRQTSGGGDATPPNPPTRLTVR